MLATPSRPMACPIHVPQVADAPGALEATRNTGPDQMITLDDHLQASLRRLDETTTTSKMASPKPSALEINTVNLGRQLGEELRKLEANPYIDVVGITRGSTGSMHNYEGINSKLVCLTLGLMFSSFSAVSARLP